MNDEEKQQIALWRYGIITPAIYGNHGFESNAEFFRNAALKPMKNPVTGKEKFFSPVTLQYWRWLYLNEGIEGLEPGSRSDKGKPRALSSQVQERITQLIQEHPKIQNTQVVRILKEEGVCGPKICQRSVDRFIKNTLLSQNVPLSVRGQEKKAFECAHANDVWQADTTFIGKIQGRQVALMVIEDDASRLIVGWGIFFEDNALNFQAVLKEALAVYGKPKCLYTDNGAPYKNSQLEMICARLQINLSHHPPYQPTYKGKVERLNNTIKRKCFDLTEWTNLKSLDQPRELFKRFLAQDYQNSPHSALKDENGNLLTPRERFLKDAGRIAKIGRDRLDEAFVHTYTRKIRQDSVIQLNTHLFDVPSEYCGQTVTVFIDPNCIERAWILPQGSKEKIAIKLLDKVVNSETPRRKGISYTRQEESRQSDGYRNEEDRK